MATAATAPGSFGDTRLRQIRRLVALQREHTAEFNALGCTLTRHAIFAMVLDCHGAGVPQAALVDALKAVTPAMEDLV